MTREEWGPLAEILIGAYPHDFKDHVMEPRLDAFFFALMVYPFEAVGPAVYQALRTIPKFLAPADVVKLIEAPDADPTSAWTEVCEWASRVSIGPTYRAGQIIPPAPLTDPAAIRAAESMGGAEAIRARTVEGEAAMRAHFFRAYTEAQTKLLRSPGQAAPALPAAPAPKVQSIGPVRLRDSLDMARAMPHQEDKR